MKLFEEFGAMTVGDVLDILSEVHDISEFRDTYSMFLDTYVTALPIDILANPELQALADKFQELVEEYYEHKDKELQRIKYQMAQARFVASYAQKAMRTNDKIQANKSSKAVDKGKR